MIGVRFSWFYVSNSYIRSPSVFISPFYFGRWSRGHESNEGQSPASPL